MSDSLIKALAYNKEVRIYVIDATEMVEEARVVHDSWSVATAALGRSMIGTTLIGATLKNEQDKLTLRLQGDGPIGEWLWIQICMDKQKHIKKSHVSLDLNKKGKLDVKGPLELRGR